MLCYHELLVAAQANQEDNEQVYHQSHFKSQIDTKMINVHAEKRFLFLYDSAILGGQSKII